MKKKKNKFLSEEGKLPPIKASLSSLIDKRAELLEQLDALGQPSDATSKSQRKLRAKMRVLDKAIRQKRNELDIKKTNPAYKPPGRQHGRVRSVSVSEYLKNSDNENSLHEEDTRKPENTPVIERDDSLSAKQDHKTEQSISGTFGSDQLMEILDRSDTEELQEVWDSRFTLLSNRQDAARVLAKIRFLRGADAVQRNHEDFLDSNLLEGLPDAESSEDSESDVTIALPIVDDRRKGTVVRTLREGQASFRQALIEAFGAKCMVTGESLSSVLEAAHIRPYHGSSSNTLENGLILRVDIHRLYDSHQLSIDPQTFKIVITEDLKNSSYSDLSESILKRRRSSISIRALEDHWSEFKRKQSSL